MRKIPEQAPYLDNPVLIKQSSDGMRGKPYEYHQGRIYTHKTEQGFEITNEVNNKTFLMGLPTFLKTNSNYQSWLDVGAVTDYGKIYFSSPEGRKELKDLESVIALAKSQG